MLILKITKGIYVKKISYPSNKNMRMNKFMDIESILSLLINYF